MTVGARRGRCLVAPLQRVARLSTEHERDFDSFLTAAESPALTVDDQQHFVEQLARAASASLRRRSVRPLRSADSKVANVASGAIPASHGGGLNGRQVVDSLVMGDRHMQSYIACVVRGVDEHVEQAIVSQGQGVEDVVQFG